MKSTFEAALREKLQATGLVEGDTLQSLWSGYGTIRRYGVEGATVRSIIVKHVRPPSGAAEHPRGWNTERSHQRKLKSYEVESAWYRTWSQRCAVDCRVPECYAVDAVGTELYIALEDLDAAGFPGRLSSVTPAELALCVRWLAHFHATFLGVSPQGLWDVGTYWHLDTRPDELERMEGSSLRSAATSIDLLLRRARFQTFVHGDAKIANFCFARDRESVAAVDFQYVGGGCGMKDLIYLLGSCLSSEQCEALEGRILTFYFGALAEALEVHHPDVDAAEVEREWRALYAPAWADFTRFLKGWSPDHWKLNRYAERLTDRTVASIQQLLANAGVE
ncbi:MAG: phosphotransferase [Pseudomonadota bacterium]